MLLVPLAIVLIGRSLAPTLDRLQGLFGGAARAQPTVVQAAPDPASPPLRVRVVDTDGTAIGGASVRLVSLDAASLVLAEVQTDITGHAAFAVVPAGRHLHAIASHDPEGVVTSTEVIAREGQPIDLELVLSAAETIVGTVVDAEEHPVAKAALSIEGMPWAIAESSATDADGAFRLTTVPHEAATLVATARGYLPGRVSLASRRDKVGPALVTLRIQLVKGEAVEGDVTDVDGKPVRARVIACEGEAAEARTATAADGTFTLPPTATGCSVIATHESFSASDPAIATPGRRLALRLKSGSSIEGVVVDERGQPVTRFAVGIETSTSAHGTSLRTGDHWSFEDRGGAFRIENIAPGTYVLSATATGKPPTKSDPIEVSAAAPTRGVRIVLAAGGVVKGHVYDEQRAPVSGVALSFDGVSNAVLSTAHATSDDTGAYALEGAPSGPFTVKAEKSGYRARLIAGLSVANGATLPQDITLTVSRDGAANTELGGIGASLVPGNGDGPMIRGVFPGDPAEKSGLLAGDVILSVDGQPTEGMPLTDVLQRLRGEAGTSVGITVRRGVNPATTFEALVVRAVVVH